MVPLSYYIGLSFVLFVTGMVGVMIRRNIILILMSIELILNSVNICFAAFSHYSESLDGQIFVFFVMTIAAAEVAIGLAIVITVYRHKASLNVDNLNLLKW